jgi:hypothetical protein
MEGSINEANGGRTTLERPSIGVIAVAYENISAVEMFIGSFKVQDNPNWKLFLIHDGPPSVEYRNVIDGRYPNDDPRVIPMATPRRYNDWGHSLRRLALNDQLTKEYPYTLITNADNYYAPCFVRYMLQATSGMPYLVYCNMLHDMKYETSKSYKPVSVSLKYCEVDIGSVIVRTDIAQKNGWRSLAMNSDWTFIEDIMHQDLFWATKVDRTLFVHN